MHASSTWCINGTSAVFEVQPTNIFKPISQQTLIRIRDKSINLNLIPLLLINYLINYLIHSFILSFQCSIYILFIKKKK